VIVAYELLMADQNTKDSEQSLRYQQPAQGIENGEWLTLAMQYKKPGAAVSEGIEFKFGKESYTDKPGSDWRFAAGLIEFGMIASGSEFAGTSSLTSAKELINSSESSDTYREELTDLISRF
jgi:hypothetical protein